jgi:hypothetical protein
MTQYPREVALPYGPVLADGAVTVTVEVRGGAVTVRVGALTVTLVLFEVFTVDVTGVVTVVVFDPPLPETASAIPTPAARATRPVSRIGQKRFRFGRKFAPQVGQNSAAGGTLLPQLGQVPGVGSGGGPVIGTKAARIRPTGNHPVRMISTNREDVKWPRPQRCTSAMATPAAPRCIRAAAYRRPCRRRTSTTRR